MKPNKKIVAATILRWGLAFVFFYAAISSLLNPDNWIGYMPGFLVAMFPAKLLLVSFSIFEIVLASMLFLGRKIVLASAVAAAALVAMTIFNTGAFDVVFRDVGLACAAFALWELSKERKEVDGKDII